MKNILFVALFILASCGTQQIKVSPELTCALHELTPKGDKNDPSAVLRSEALGIGKRIHNIYGTLCIRPQTLYEQCLATQLQRPSAIAFTWNFGDSNEREKKEIVTAYLAALAGGQSFYKDISYSRTTSELQRMTDEEVKRAKELCEKEATTP